MNSYFYHGVWRLDFGFGNPNKTAALIAMVMIVLWVVALLRRSGFWIALVIVTGLGIALIHTFSRGGIIAFVCGIIPVVWAYWHLLDKKKVIGICVSIAVIIVSAFLIGAQERYEQGILADDASIGNRLQIWRCAPRMMVDAPNGWGFGNAGKAYVQWYQPLNRLEHYRTLVNSHLTWLVEMSWPFRFIYITSWLMVFALCWPSNNLRKLAIPFGVWLTFGVSAFFSSVAESPWLWILPITCLSTAFGCRIKAGIWPSRTALSAPIYGSCLVLLICYVLGRGDPAIESHQNYVIIGKGNPSAWIIIDTRVNGWNYGHTLRSYLDSSTGRDESIGVVEDAADLPTLRNATILFCGGDANRAIDNRFVASADKIILLNPYFFPSQINLKASPMKTLSVYFGDFSRSPALEAWMTTGPVQRLPGAGDYVLDWPKVIPRTNHS